MIEFDLMFPDKVGSFSNEVLLRRFLTDGFIKNTPGSRPWRTYDSSVDDYQDDLAAGLPVPLIDFINSKQNPVILDLMASAAGLRDLFKRTHSEPELGIAVAYEDVRSPSQRASDLLSGIFQLRSDLADRQSWVEIGDILDGEVDLIIQRGRAGVDSMPAHRGFYNTVKRHLWAALARDGLMVSQVHNDQELRSAGINLSRWTSRLNRIGVQARYVPGVPVLQRDANNDCYGIVSLVKTPNAPKYLPMI